MNQAATYLDVIARHATQTPDAVALRDPSGEVTFGQLGELIGQVAHGLRERGVQSGDRVAIAMRPSAANLVVMFAAMAAGAVAAPVNISLSRPERGVYLRRIRPALAVVTEQYADLADADALPPLCPLESTAGAAAQVLAPLTTAAAAPLRTTTLDPDAPAIMFGTGGTTGVPKAAAWSHRALWLYAASCSAAMEVRRTDIELFFSPLFHIALVTGPFGTLWSGGTIHVLPEFDAQSVADLLSAGRVTRLFGAPTALMRVIGTPGFDPARMGRVRRVLFGSTRSEPDLAERLAQAFPNAEFVTGYGATEYGAVVRLRSWEYADGLDHGVGRAVPGVEVLVVGPGEEILGTSQVGELVVRAPWQMLGYWGGDAAENERAFVHGGVRSGDLGERDATGCIHLRGRLKDIVITGGENVFPVEVEDVLSAHPAVAEVAVVGVLDREWGERVEAVIVPVASAPTPTDAEWTAFCRERLARYKVPKRFHLVQALPLTGAMKVDKRALRESLADA